MVQKKKSPEQKKEDHAKKDEDLVKKAREIAEQIQQEVRGASEEDILKDLPTAARKEETHKEEVKEESKEEIPHHYEGPKEQSETSQEYPKLHEEKHHEEKKPEVHDEPTPRYDETLAEVEASPQENLPAGKTEKTEPISETKPEEISSNASHQKEKNYKADMAFSSLFTNNDSDAKRKKLILLFVVVALLTVLLSTGGFYYANHTGKLPIPFQEKPSPTPTVTPTLAPTPTPITMSSYTIEVLNGSGTAGEAGKVADLLKPQQFKSIDTGNANSYNFKQTEVAVKSTTPDEVYSSIVSALSGTYDVTKSAQLLSASSKYDAVVTVGSTKK